MQKKSTILGIIAIWVGFTCGGTHALTAQTVIGGQTPDPSAMLDVQSTEKGFLFPRMASTERDAISNAATGLIIFNTTTVCLEINLGAAGSASWQSIQCLGSITTLDCATAVLIGTLAPGQAASGVSVSVPYTGGNGGVHLGQTVTSTVITGLTATLSAGSFASGSDNLSYAITGTPSGSGTAEFALNIGGQTCTLSLTVQQNFTLQCASAIRTGEMQPGTAASGVSVMVPYTNGNGTNYGPLTINSTVVTGYTATLAGGTLANGSGTLTFDIMGTGNIEGDATFALSIGSSNCDLKLRVKECSAKTSSSVTKKFSCYNLGAYNTSVDPLEPSWEINGGYWRWGTTSQAAAGPTGSDLASANEGTIANWSALPVGAVGDWLDASKGPKDPCPDGFKVPSTTQWTGVWNNNGTAVMLGTWNASPTNYSFGAKIGTSLFLPAAGLRDNTNLGALLSRGAGGRYWSSTSASSTTATGMVFNQAAGSWSNTDRDFGFGQSIRCISIN